jgi:hypothetical protein
VRSVDSSGIVALGGGAVDDPASGAIALPMEQQRGLGAGTVDTSVVTSTTVSPARDPGMHTFWLEAHVARGSGTPVAANACVGYQPHPQRDRLVGGE